MLFMCMYVCDVGSDMYGLVFVDDVISVTASVLLSVLVCVLLLVNARVYCCWEWYGFGHVSLVLVSVIL